LISVNGESDDVLA